MLMCNIFKIVLLVGSSSLACSPSAGALHLRPSVPAVEVVVEYELGEFSQPIFRSLLLNVLTEEITP